jgi:hypothetical protein
MLRIDIKPLSGIDIQNIGKINLGQNRKDVERTIGLPNSSKIRSFNDLKTDSSFYDMYEFRIDYDGNNTVEFIEFIYGPFPTKADLRIYEVDPFKVDATKLIEILSHHDSGKVNDLEAPYSFAFENISVGIWRQSSPLDMQELIDEKKEDKTYDIDKDWTDEELEKSNHFWTIGIGRKDYYRS